jgi:hypothetical protein
MAATRTKKSDSDLAGTAALVSNLSQNPQAAADPNLSALAAILARKLAREEAEYELQEEQRKEQQRQGAMAMETRRKAQAQAQDNCPHMKPWGGSALAGQRTHQHDTLLICQFCGKLFVGETIPPHLRVPAERVGGPQN